MDDPLRVGKIEGAADRLDKLDDTGERIVFAELPLECATLDQFGRQVEGAVILAKVEDRQDVGVAQAGRDPRFEAETLDEGGIVLPDLYRSA